MMVEAVIVGGTDTTRNQLGCAVALFAEHPDQWRLLAEQPELAPRAVEEAMRYFGAVRGTGRFASEDIEYRGVLFPAGTFIAPSMATANFDESVFSDPGHVRHHPRAGRPAAADVRLGHPLLPRRRPRPGRAAGGAPAAGPPHARPRPRRPDHVEAQRRRHLRPRPPPRHLHPHPHRLTVRIRRTVHVCGQKLTVCVKSSGIRPPDQARRRVGGPARGGHRGPRRPWRRRPASAARWLDR